jgi:SAM-dependent methyltransferase
MFFPDRVAAYAQARRVLKPRGKFIFSVWDRIEQNEFAAAVTESIGLLFPEDPPQFLARTPHGYHDVTQVRADIARSRGLEPERCGSPFLFDRVKKLTAGSAAAHPEIERLGATLVVNPAAKCPGILG